MTLPDSPVALVRCGDYDPVSVEKAVADAMEMIGGIGRFVSPGMRVLVKPNLLTGAPPDACICTHPAVVRAVAAMLLAHGCRVVIADSPGGGIPYTESNLKKHYHLAGYDVVAEETGAELGYETTYSTIPYHDGRVMKQFSVITAAREADAIVVVSKLKTHMFTRMTGAAKNLFGIVPGLEKPVFHSRFSDPEKFASMIVDLNCALPPVLQVMDAVAGMEGDGPNSGTPRKIGAILASPSAFALDCVAARLIGLDPGGVATIRDAAERGLVDPAGGVEVRGEDPATLAVAGFAPPATFLGGDAPSLSLVLRMAFRLGRRYALHPVIDREVCTGCGMCVRICPEGAAVLKDKKATINLSRCIRCYCCHEMCPEDAIRLERGLFGRLVRAVTGEG